jgi:hypothetical protein
VQVRRINGEEARGVIAEGPIQHLRHIGEFYIVAQRVPTVDKPVAKRNSGRKSNRMLQYESETGRIGMYERAYIIL